MILRSLAIISPTEVWALKVGRSVKLIRVCVLRVELISSFFYPSNLTASKQQFRSNWSNYTPSQLESSFVSNIHRLFSERIEIFSSVEFSKVSIVTGIIKISLKVGKIQVELVTVLIDFISRLYWNVFDYERLVNLVCNRFRWMLIIYKWIYGVLCLMRSK